MSNMRFTELENLFSSIATELKAKLDDVESCVPADFPELIDRIPIGDMPEGDMPEVNLNYSYLNFYDYEGTILYRFTEEEANALTELPELPEHEGLICQGWNHTLNEIKEYGCGPIAVGAIYDTVDSKTRLYLEIPEDSENKDMLVCVQRLGGENVLPAEQVVTIDWGDGVVETSEEAGYIPAGLNDNNSPVFFYHDYQASGEFVIKISVPENTHYILGGESFITENTADQLAFSIYGLPCFNDDSNYLLADITSMTASNEFSFAYSLYNCGSFIKHARVGSESIIKNATFANCKNLESVVLSNFQKREDISGIGYVKAFNGCYNLKHINLPNNNINTIGAYAFSSINSYIKQRPDSYIAEMNNFNGLKSISMPVEIKTIDKYCFTYNSKLEYISSMAEQINNYAFYHCFLLTDINLPKTHTIESSAFLSANCSGVLNIPSLITIGSNAFAYAELKEISLPLVENLDNSVFYMCSNLKSFQGENISSIGNDVFSYCASIENVYLPNLEEAGYSCFANCFRIEEIDLPLLKTVGENSYQGFFEQCNSLRHVNLPELKNISSYMFRSCCSLIEIELNSVITSSASNADFFNHCENLERVSIPNLINTGFASKQGGFEYCSNLKEVNIENWTELPHFCFQYCYKLERVYAPNVTTVGNYVFDICYNLKEVILPKVTALGSNFFRACHRLERFVGGNITSLGNYAFTGCSSLKEFDASSLTSIGKEVFLGTAIENFELNSYSGSLSNTSIFSKNENVKTIYMPNVTSISDYAMGECPNLENVTFGALTGNLNYTFINDYSLKEFIVPSGITTLNRTFINCFNLEKVTFEDGSSSKVLKDGVFENCCSLKTIDFSQLTIVPQISSYSFMKNTPVYNNSEKTFENFEILVSETLYNNFVSAFESSTDNNMKALSKYVKIAESSEE